eukprot:TRINITY_DN10960_c0_g1_i1.p1 TRINITY_DN10960_c0_g1~~TRINITY_DN10960_c0_g1_i1.p1  ORF type:complete len:130 (-),score=14.84 TRINITY_DN10960_c0_g1_i1:106-495(-)
MATAVVSASVNSPEAFLHNGTFLNKRPAVAPVMPVIIVIMAVSAQSVHGSTVSHVSFRVTHISFGLAISPLPSPSLQSPSCSPLPPFPPSLPLFPPSGPLGSPPPIGQSESEKETKQIKTTKEIIFQVD